MNNRPVWLQQLDTDMEEAARAFATETDHGEKLFAAMRSVGAVTQALSELGLKEQSRPLLAIIEGLDHLVQGIRDPLLSRRRRRPQTSGTRMVEQTAAVLVAKYLIGCGFTVSTADETAAKLLASHGVYGQGRLPVTRRTVTDWRLNAGRSRGLRTVHEQVALYLPEPDPTATREHAVAAATEAASRILSVRS